MSFPCFSTKALALVASSDSNQGELNLKPDLVLGDINSASRVLAEQACAKIQVVA